MKIVFTDLDGTLLDHDSYSFTAAKKSLQWLNTHNIPVIFCTSKTRKEILYWKQKMKNIHPFIAENGGGIFIPKDYFSFSFRYTEEKEEYVLIRFGAPFERLKEMMNQLESQFKITSFLSMSVSDLCSIAGLSKADANRALQRDFDIPFIIHDNTEKEDIINEINKKKLNVTKGGRFYHLLGDNDKGKAVTVLGDLFHKAFDGVETIGIGDSANDFPMLHAVDRPYLVMKKDQSFASDLFAHSKGIGPYGWRKVVDLEFDISTD